MERTLNRLLASVAGGASVLSLEAPGAAGTSSGCGLACQGPEQLRPAPTLFTVSRGSPPSSSIAILQHASRSPAAGPRRPQAPPPALHHLLTPSQLLRPQWECSTHHFRPAVEPQTTNRAGGGGAGGHTQRLCKPLHSGWNIWRSGLLVPALPPPPPPGGQACPLSLFPHFQLGTRLPIRNVWTP